MTVIFNIGEPAKDMSLEDKARILFADRNKQSETSGLERLLTPKEEIAILEDATKKGQIEELNKLNSLYFMANFLLSDIQTAYLNFWLAEYKLEQILTTIFIIERGKDILYQNIYELTKGDKEKGKELVKRYMDQFYSGTYLSEELTSFLNENGEVNRELQRYLINAVKRFKEYRKIRYQLDYVVNEKTDINFLGDQQKQDLKKHDNSLKAFINSEGALTPLKRFGDVFLKHGAREDLETNQEFFRIVEDINKAVEITAEDKKEAMEQINNILSRADV